MREEFLTLIGFNGNILDLSNELQDMGCEDICYFGNMEEILDSESIIVATNETGEEHIEIFFEVLRMATLDEIIQATTIEIIKIEEF